MTVSRCLCVCVCVENCANYPPHSCHIAHCWLIYPYGRVAIGEAGGGVEGGSETEWEAALGFEVVAVSFESAGRTHLGG